MTDKLTYIHSFCKKIILQLLKQLSIKTHISLPEASNYLKELDAGDWLLHTQRNVISQNFDISDKSIINKRDKVAFKYQKPFKGVIFSTSKIYLNIAYCNILFLQQHLGRFLKTVISTLKKKCEFFREARLFQPPLIKCGKSATCEQTMSCAVIFLKCSSLSFGTEYWLQNCNSKKQNSLILSQKRKIS